MRLRYGGSASTWGFALYLAGSDTYEDTILPTDSFAGSLEDALDCGLYLATPASDRTHDTSSAPESAPRVASSRLAG
ncbi:MULTISPECIES: hypothetical protein [unclassified Kitasatospora]|uniref:hypothetical protein n=1 Tax=unclassified Kitasatospora TaxID=2633591 RepID=UPI0033E82D8E